MSDKTIRIVTEAEGVSEDTTIELSDQEAYYIEDGKIIKYNTKTDNTMLMKRIDDLESRIIKLEKQ